MLPSQHLFESEVIFVRRVKTGEEDGTPIYAEDPEGIDWPEDLNRMAYIDYDEDIMTVVSQNGIGSVTMLKATLIMEPGVAEVIQETDNAVFDNNRWRLETIVQPRSLWGPRHTQIRVSRQKNA